MKQNRKHGAKAAKRMTKPEGTAQPPIESVRTKGSTKGGVKRITNIRANANGISGGGPTPGTITG